MTDHALADPVATCLEVETLRAKAARERRARLEAEAIAEKTIAEFVESDAILTKLREFGVDFVQGYHVGRPARVEELLPLRWA